MELKSIGVWTLFDATVLWAIESKNYEIVESLLQRGADPNCTEQGVEKPLTGALYFGSEAAVELLLEWGADPGIKDVFGNTPLHHSVYDNKSDAKVKLLLK
jgi:ankyrin repeat protein